MKKTDYKIETIENGWVVVFKENKLIADCIDEDAGLHAIWTKEGKDKNIFFKVDVNGNVFRGLKCV